MKEIFLDKLTDFIKSFFPELLFENKFKIVPVVFPIYTTNNGGYSLPEFLNIVVSFNHIPNGFYFNFENIFNLDNDDYDFYRLFTDLSFNPNLC